MSVWEHTFRNQTIFLHNIDKHVELATVIQRLCEKIVMQTALWVLWEASNKVLEKIITLLILPRNTRRAQDVEIQMRILWNGQGVSPLSPAPHRRNATMYTLSQRKVKL